METNELLEQAEHISHAGHGEEHEHAAKHDRFGLFVGITMATLGVLLAFCAAKVGGERTELIQSLVEQQKAHQEWLGNDIKHRVAFIDLLEMHSVMSAAALKELNKDESMFMADTVDRYLGESDLAKKWEDAYAGAIDAHVFAQEHYETGQLFAEIGIVVASVALLLKRRIAWYGALVLGAVSVYFVASTYVRTSRAVQEAEHLIEEHGETYVEARTKHKTTDAEKAIVDSVRSWGGKSPAPNIAGSEGAAVKEGEHKAH